MDKIENQQQSDFVVHSNTSKLAIKTQLENHNINTIYLPIDGTRRYFISQRGIDYRDPRFFEEYFNFSINKMISLLRRVFDMGFKYVIVLLMDNTAFSRGRQYLDNAISMGIEPLLDDERFTAFYEEYDLNVVFGGYNRMYEEYGFYDLTQRLEEVNQNARQNSDSNLIFYTGPEHEMDAISMALSDPNFSPSTPREQIKELMYKSLYPIKIPKIDVSVFYGYPRDKVTPAMLSGESVNFYTSNPSLEISPEQLKKIVYLVTRTIGSIKDQYIKYDIERISANPQSLLGEEWYTDY